MSTEKVGQDSTTDEWLYCFLPDANSEEFPELDVELRRRGVIAEVAEVEGGGGRVYRVHRSCLSKLPRDEKGPYIGSDDSGHFLFKWQGPEGKGPWKSISRFMSRPLVLSELAQLNVEETGVDLQDDIEALRSGRHTAETLLAHCLDGADEDRVHGWKEYVDAVVEAAAMPASPPRLTAAQRTGLARVIDCFDRGHPVFAPSNSVGTRDLSVGIRRQLEGLGLIERYDYAAERKATRPNEAVAPFIYFRPTAMGRAALDA